MNTLIIQSEEELENLAREIALELDKKNIIFLIGNLGAGKTTFTKYLSQLVGITEPVISPTFILHREYKINFQTFKKLHHIDFYRIDDLDELKELNLNKLDITESVIVIEWADKFIDYLKNVFPISKTLNIEIEVLDNISREVKIS